MASLYTVYHIPGIKYGCTNDIHRRSKENRQTYGKSIEINNVYETTNIEEADELEQFLNSEAQYKTQQTSYIEITQKGNKFKFKTGITPWNKGLDNLPSTWNKGLTKETNESIRKQSEAITGHEVSIETRGKISKANTGRINSPQQNELISKANTGRVYDIVTCPHCNKTGGSSGMKSWHFEYCKQNPNKLPRRANA